MRRPKRQVQAELYISNENAKPFFFLLRQQKNQIEQQLNYALEWEELPEGRDTRVSVALSDVDPENRGDWPRQHQWLATHLNDLHKVFGPRVRALNANDWIGPDDPIPDAAVPGLEVG